MRGRHNGRCSKHHKVIISQTKVVDKMVELVVNSLKRVADVLGDIVKTLSHSRLGVRLSGGRYLGIYRR